MNTTKNQLYLIPSTLGDTPLSSVLPDRNRKIINNLSTFIVEDLKSARRFLRKAGYKGSFEEITFHVYNEHSEVTDLAIIMNALSSETDVGLLSDAGLPCVADPGAEIVREAHQKNIKIIPLTGPSSIFLALMASGFNGQNFAFNGYLPIGRSERIRKIKQLETKIYKENQTQLFIEAPYRNRQLIEALIKACHDDTRLCIASDLTTETEYIRTKKMAAWKKGLPDIHKRPTVFLLYK
ncbi:MAG: SAM-dependent methyltransferase [Bacteroidales bacterium]|nr:SAM-dependent methyltransferase [Bacteroidales bacterium]